MTRLYELYSNLHESAQNRPDAAFSNTLCVHRCLVGVFLAESWRAHPEVLCPMCAHVLMIGVLKQLKINRSWNQILQRANILFPHQQNSWSVMPVYSGRTTVMRSARAEQGFTPRLVTFALDFRSGLRGKCSTSICEQAASENPQRGCTGSVWDWEECCFTAAFVFVSRLV